MNTLNDGKKLAVLSALLEGCSIRSVVRMTGVHKTTILRLLVKMGGKCEQILDQRMRDINCEALELDELWAYVFKKQRRLTSEDSLNNPEWGDVYTFIAFDPESKLVVSYRIGKRDSDTTLKFIQDVYQRVTGQIQISTDGFSPYIEAIENTFGSDVHYAQIIKVFNPENPGSGRYSPPKVDGIKVKEISGRPKRSRVCTSYVERNNLNIRMGLRRFTRLTNAFSKKFENLKASLSLYFWFYNFCRIHGSLKITPAMAAGVSNKLMTLEDLLDY